jgi:hypothetical protein
MISIVSMAQDVAKQKEVGLLLFYNFDIFGITYKQDPVT